MTAAALPVVLQVAGGAVAAYSAFSASQANKKATAYQAAVSRNNAMVAEWNAKDIARRGEQDLVDQRRRTALLAGTQRAALAGRGIDLSEGSALNILSDTTYLGEQDALTVKDNTAKNVWAAKVQANNDYSNAELLQARSDSENPWLSAGGSLLTNAGKVHSAWKTYTESTPASVGYDYGYSTEKKKKFYE